MAATVAAARQLPGANEASRVADDPPPSAPQKMSAPKSSTDQAARPVADAPAGNWVDRYAPPEARPYLRLARMDRPIGTWLLLFPCWWSQALAEVWLGKAYPNLWHLALFAIGALVMRGAGCAFNDYVDRDIDAKVARTASRPIPSGQVSPRDALIFVVALSLIGFLVLIQFNGSTIWLGIASLALVAAYPFMKRFTYWPQLVLGLTFNWGALVGWSAETGSLALAPVLMYAGAVAWTIGYDTIYAHQDKEDDLMLGLKSTALKFGTESPIWVGGFYAGAIGLWAAAGYLVGAQLVLFAALGLVGVQMAWQVATLDIDDASNCLSRFRSNRDVGAAIFLGLVADMMAG